MPWSVKKQGGKYCVVKDTDGSTLKCYSDKAEAVAYQRALYANEKAIGEGTTSEEEVEKGYCGDECESTYVPWGVTTFAELEQAEQEEEKINSLHKLLRKFKALIDNIFWSNEVSDKGAAITRLSGEFATLVKNPPMDDKAADDKAIDDNVVASSEGVTGGSPMFFQKDATDPTRLRWFAVFTNKFRDNDHPAEILSDASHLDFAKSVSDGSWPYPELWLAHIPNSRWGMTDFITYESDAGFMLASGLVDIGKEAVAEALSTVPDIAVSHGMPRAEIVRDASNPTVYTRYRSKEISPLSRNRAANKLTGFILMEADMAFEPKGAEERLAELFGGDDERVAKVQAALNLASKAAAEAGIEYKSDGAGEEVEGQEPETQTQKDDVPDAADEVADSENAESKEADGQDTEGQDDKQSEPEAQGESEVAKEVQKLGVELIEAIGVTMREALEAQTAKMDAQAEELKALTARLASLERSDEEKMAEQAAWTTRAAQPSIMDALRQRVIGKDAALVDGRTKEAAGPLENKGSDPVSAAFEMFKSLQGS